MTIHETLLKEAGEAYAAYETAKNGKGVFPDQLQTLRREWLELVETVRQWQIANRDSLTSGI